MKKKILALGIVLALLSALVAPVAVFADTTDVTGEVGDVPTVSAISPNTGSYLATVAATITGTNFVVGQEAVTTVTFSGTEVTASSVVIVSVTSITATITITIDALAGTRDVIVTVAGKASTTGTDLFTVEPYITVGAPTGIGLGYMTASTTETDSSVDGTVATNDDVWSVTAIDAKGNATGYMNTQADGLGISLAAIFQIGAEDTVLANADVGVTYDQGDTTPLVLELYVSQAVGAAETAGSYQITITFTGSN